MNSLYVEHTAYHSKVYMISICSEVAIAKDATKQIESQKKASKLGWFFALRDNMPHTCNHARPKSSPSVNISLQEERPRHELVVLIWGDRSVLQHTEFSLIRSSAFYVSSSSSQASFAMIGDRVWRTKTIALNRLMFFFNRTFARRQLFIITTRGVFYLVRRRRCAAWRYPICKKRTESVRCRREGDMYLCECGRVYPKKAMPLQTSRCI